MPRPTTRKSLLDQSARTFGQLMELVDSIPPEAMQRPGVNGPWSAKDVLAHLHAWHRLLERWYAEGMAGRTPSIPAPGYTWKTTPALNAAVFRGHRERPLKAVLRDLRASHARVHGLIRGHLQAELFTQSRYSWTGSTSLAVYFRGSTCSHCEWAIALIRKWQKAGAGRAKREA